MPQNRWSTSRRGFLQTLGAAGAVAGGFLPAKSWAQDIRPFKSSPEIPVGSRRQLLFDDFFLALGNAKLEDFAHNIRWTLGSVQKSPSRDLFGSTERWEDSTAWLCVLHDGGKYRLWYNASKQPHPGLFVSYAESDDGLTWRKPVLNLVEVNGSKQNNVVFTGGPDNTRGFELGSVFIDPSARPEERYKMFYPSWESSHLYPDYNLPYVGEAGVLRGAHSSDGLHWTRYQHIFLGKYADSQNVAAYDPDLGKYVAYIRWISEYGGLNLPVRSVQPARRGRSVARIESDDYLKWTYPQLALAPDFEDGLNVEFYNPGYSRYGSADHAHFMFPSAYHKREGTFLVNVATSRDNRTWMRPVRDTFIPLGESGSFDDFMISVAPGFVTAEANHLALYYRSGNMPHGGAIKSVKPRVEKPRAGMGRVLFKRDRIVGIEAGVQQGTFSTRPLLFEGRRLVVNVEPTGPDAELRVQLIGAGIEPAHSPSRGKYMDDAVVPGFTFQDSIPLTGDELDAAVRWKGSADLAQWAGKPVRLNFQLRSMRIYAFQFVP